jgi:hypothetical protein
MSEWYLTAWSFPYIASALISLWLSWDVLTRNRDSPTHQRFAVFGLTSSFYLIASFLMMISPDKDLALKMAVLSESLYFISIGLLAYFAYDLGGTKEVAWLVLIPPPLVTALSLFIPREAKLTSFGWVVTAQPSITVEGVLTFVYLASYSLLIGLAFYDLAKNSKAPWLTRKYVLMLVGFLLFQVVGVVVANSLMLVFANVPHLGGLLYFLSFVSIWYGFKMEGPNEVGSTQSGTESSEAYRRFINRFLQIAPSDELGLKTVDLLEYLDKTRLSEFVTYDRLRIILNVERMDRVDSIQALDRTMEYLESKDWSQKLAEPFLDVLETVYVSAAPSRERTETFKGVLMNHESFLRRSDVIYGFSRGQFLELYGQDGSLTDLPEWEVSLRMYKRMLLPIRKFISGKVFAEFSKKVRSMDIVKYLDVTQDGEISIDRVEAHLEALPEKGRAEAVRNGFNPLMSWIAQSLAKEDHSSFVKWLRTCRRAAVLNKGAKGAWRTYVSLTNRLSRDLGYEETEDLVLLEGHKAEDLNAFSSVLGLSHERLLHERILIEFDPRFSFEYYIGQLLYEVCANTERCVVFTRGGSAILHAASDLENVECRILATPGVQDEDSVPFNDVTRLIYAVDKALESEMETWVLFDNLSDLILPVGLEQAYVFARHSTDLISSKKATAVFLMNKAAHSQSDRAAFEGLFSTIVELGEKVNLVKRSRR